MNTKIDFIIAIAVGLLLLIGSLIHLSLGQEGIVSHLLYVGLGILAAILVSHADPKLVRLFSPHLYALILVLLVMTLIFADVTRGSQRWLELGSFRFQTSEFVKLALILVLADAIDRWGVDKWSSLVKHAVLVIVPFGLVLVQPDLGSAIILGLIVLVMLFVGGMRYRYFIIGGALLVLMSPFVWLNLREYQQARIATFLNPTIDPLGKGYNVIQSQIAVGSGQVFGRGLGHGTQSKLRFLPESHTDFVFASLAEELGLVGSLMLLISFATLVVRLSILASGEGNLYSSLVISGITAMLVAQMLINISMNVGLMPVTGITLPYISAGGSSLVISLVAIGYVHCLLPKRSVKAGIEIRAGSE